MLQLDLQSFLPLFLYLFLSVCLTCYLSLQMKSALPNPPPNPAPWQKSSSAHTGASSDLVEQDSRSRGLCWDTQAHVPAAGRPAGSTEPCLGALPCRSTLLRSAATTTALGGKQERNSVPEHSVPEWCRTVQQGCRPPIHTEAVSERQTLGLSLGFCRP